MQQRLKKLLPINNALGLFPRGPGRVQRAAFSLALIPGLCSQRSFSSPGQ